jgi:hypothetical protein
MNKNYPFGLFYLAHLLISADVIDKKEETALMRIKSKEQIANNSFREFSNNVRSLKEKEIYQQGIEMLNKCSDSEKLSAFVHLYKNVRSRKYCTCKRSSLVIVFHQNGGH